MLALSVCGVEVVRLGLQFALLLSLAALASCNRTPAEPKVQITVPEGDTAGEISWSADRRCGAVLLSNRDGHSPLTTTRVAIVEPGVEGVRELRLPPPHERFSTVLDRWERPGVLLLHATTLEGDVPARYSCTTRTLEVLP